MLKLLWNLTVKCESDLKKGPALLLHPSVTFDIVLG